MGKVKRGAVKFVFSETSHKSLKEGVRDGVETRFKKESYFTEEKGNGRSIHGT